MPDFTGLKSRFSVRRLHVIHEALQRGRFVTCATLGAELGVCRKTVVRDIAAMRDDLELPIEFDRALGAYRYTRPVQAFPTLQVTEGEVFALAVARQALKPYQGTPLYRQLQGTFDKLAAGLRDQVTFDGLPPADAVSFKHLGLGRVDPEVFKAVSKGVTARRELSLIYRKTGQREATPRRLRPYHLSNRDNLWYLVAEDVAKTRIQTFALGRMSEVTVLARRFERPANFSPETFFAHALGVLSGEARHDIRILFSAAVADRVREREWHETQELVSLPDGRLELRLQLGALAEVRQWILSWGPDAEAIAPPELRSECTDALKKALLPYTDR